MSINKGPDSEVIIKSPEDLELLLADHLIIVNHDIRGKVGIIMGWAQLIGRRPGAAKVDIINNTIKELGGFVDELLKYKKEAITVQDVENAYWQRLVVALSPHQKELRKKLSFEVSGFEALKGVPLTFTWSKVLLNETIENVAINLFKSLKAKELDEVGEEKAGTREEDVHLVRTEVGITEDEKRNKYFKICIDSNGRGYPEAVIEHGFEEAYERGQTGWGHDSIPTEGSGMRKYVKFLELNFEGKFIPENIIDDQGRVIGSRSTILLPINPLLSEIVQPEEAIEVHA